MGDTPMKTDVAGHEGVGRVFKGKHLSVPSELKDAILFLTFQIGIVGPGVDEKLWLGQRVGIRLVLMGSSALCTSALTRY
jgi:hypothetical protein